MRRVGIADLRNVREERIIVRSYFDLVMGLQGQIQGQMTGNTPAPKLLGAQLSEWSHSIQRPSKTETAQVSSKLLVRRFWIILYVTLERSNARALPVI